MHRFGVAFVPFVLGLVLGGCDLIPFGKSDESRPEKIARRAQKEAPAQLVYVGREMCTKCHEEQVQSYTTSAHDRSLELPVGPSVAAPFDGERLVGKNIQATFIRKNGAPVISLEKDHAVEWTIGFFPLQQYVIPGENGRFLAFAGAFDTREKGDGGKRWYFLNDADVRAGEASHFREDVFVWNSQCASCHSTAVEKNYDFDLDTYDTKVKELDVSCEACHGPASRHVALAEKHNAVEKWPPSIDNAGFERALSTYALRRWVRGPDEKAGKLAGEGEAPPERTDELLSCAPCHSTSTDLGPGSSNALLDFSDRFALQLIDREHYFPDGQAKADVYSYNSFLQTKMQHAGVVCSDCHNPHAGTLRSPPTELCNSCHAPDIYGAKAHTLHDEREEVTCVDCHMPERAFVGNDSRRDHSFPIPRPDLTLSMGLPNACGNCHANRPKWAASVILQKLGQERGTTPAPAFHAAEKGAEDAPQQLSELISATFTPAIFRASALKRWVDLGRPSPDLSAAILAAAKDDSEFVRRAAAEAASALAEEARIRALIPLFSDGARSVRVAAALASLKAPAPEKPIDSMQKALSEARTAASFRSDSADGLLTWAALEEGLGDSTKHLRLLELAVERFPDEPRTFSSLAATLTRAGQVDKAQEVALRGLKLHPGDPLLLFARGRHLVRIQNSREALAFLHNAFEAAPRSLRREYGYVYAVTTYELGDWAEALSILRLLKREYPEAMEVKEALTLYEGKRAHR